MIRRSPTRGTRVPPADLVRRGLASLVLAAVALVTVVVSTTQVAGAVTAGAEVLVTPGTTRALASGGSTTPYGVVLPAGASCPGDTAHDGYHVFTYLVPSHASPTDVSFTTGLPSRWYGYIAEGAYVGCPEHGGVDGADRRPADHLRVDEAHAEHAVRRRRPHRHVERGSRLRRHPRPGDRLLELDHPVHRRCIRSPRASPGRWSTRAPSRRPSPSPCGSASACSWSRPDSAPTRSASVVGTQPRRLTGGRRDARTGVGERARQFLTDRCPTGGRGRARTG